jgi:hypothetical protein
MHIKYGDARSELKRGGRDMTDIRKAELFDKVIEWIMQKLIYAKRWEYVEVLEEVGFTDEEIDEMLSGMFFGDDDELEEEDE